MSWRSAETSCEALAGGGPWFLMEHSTSAVNWQPVNIAKQPGELLRTSLGHVARGADAVGFFQWRASRAGAEKFHSALLPHAGTDTKVWREVSELGTILGRAADVAGTRVDPARVVLLFDWPARWAADLDSHPSSLVRAMDAPVALHRALWRRGVPVDVRRPDADLSDAAVVLVPSLYLVDDTAVARISGAAEAGAHVVVTYFSGIVDENDHIRLGGYPGAFAELLGISTEEFFPLRADQTVRLTGPDNASWTGSQWSELTRLRGAEAVAVHADGPVAGHPAVTRHTTSGGGNAWYLGTSLDPTSLDAVLALVLDGAGVTPPTRTPERVEVVRRSAEDRSFLFVLNHGGSEAAVPAVGHDLVADRAVEGIVTVPAGGVAIVRERR